MGLSCLVRLPGRAYEEFRYKAAITKRFGMDLDLCEPLDRARLRAHGAGYSAYVTLDADQVDRLAAWVSPDDPRLLHDCGERMLAIAADARRGAGYSPEGRG